MGKGCVGIIGGSGLYNMEGVEIEEEKRIATPYGPTSDAIYIGRLDGTPVAFLSRHGRGHRINPSEINYRANIYALKTVGVGQIIGISAVGSMKEELHPGNVVVVDQLIDRTKGRPGTFFDRGIVAHIAFADPFCERVADIVYGAAKDLGAGVKRGGTYVCIEGPAFSTRAESNLYRSWGVDVIGMTCYQEARLAREAEICYATAAMVTDYDCWHETEEDVSIQAILDVLKKNVETARNILKNAVPKVYKLDEHCACREALKYAIITDPRHITEEAKRRLEPIIGRYL